MTILSRLQSRLSAPGRQALYFGRALSEIALIVIGILIAIQFDNWNERRSEKQLEQSYIHNLIEDLRFDVERSSAWFDRFDDKINGLQTAKDYYFGDLPAAQGPEFIKTIGFGGAGSRGRLLANNTTFEELLSTGNLRVIQDDELRAKIIDYYSQKKFVAGYADNLRSEYASYVNSSSPYSPRGGITFDARDLPVSLERFKQPRFLTMVNKELTFAYSVDNVMRLTVEDARDLAERLENYLEASE
ncbi:DUF6090 family protein [Congregibacter brevis]|uniref:DUF6090 family protein n=1 Tax=Congregibacter brevis TaxID=3081201 RepID=A0ABZ0ID31_9GAMM|nr:DUF6090 family protein [Congregibacter sp. IMCC45268]